MRGCYRGGLLSIIQSTSPNPIRSFKQVSTIAHMLANPYIDLISTVMNVFTESVCCSLGTEQTEHSCRSLNYGIFTPKIN